MSEQPVIAAPPPRDRSFHDVRGSARDDVWVVGDAGAILHWDGRG